MKKISFFTLCSILLINVNSFSQEQTDALKLRYEEQLTPIIEKMIQTWKLPGVSIAVVDDGRPVYVHGFGKTDIDGGSPVNERSLFHLASVSKPFIATAIMILVEEGKVDLDEKVTTYLPYFSLDDPRAANITIRQLVTHTSGMPDVADYEWDNPKTGDDELERWVRSLSNRQLLFDPGTSQQYSNIGFEVLGDVVAKASGMSLEDFLKTRILEPVGMKDSSFFYPETDKSLRTKAHVIGDNGALVASEIYPYNRRHAASSTLNSNAVDMARWLVANLNKGEIDGKRFIGKEAYAQLLTPSLENFSNIGLSWFIQPTQDGNTLYHHSGGDLGFVSICIFIPDRRFGVAVMTNCQRGIPARLMQIAYAISKGQQPSAPPAPASIALAETAFGESGKAAVALWHSLKKDKADEYSFSASDLNSLGYSLMQRDRNDDAIAILTLQTEEFGTEANPWDSLGEAYWKAGDLANAKRCYSKAVEIDPSMEGAKQALAAINAGTAYDQR